MDLWPVSAEEDKRVLMDILATYLELIPGKFDNPWFGPARANFRLLAFSQLADQRAAKAPWRTAALFAVGTAVQRFEQKAMTEGSAPLFGTEWGPYPDVVAKVFYGLAAMREADLAAPAACDNIDSFVLGL